MDCLNIVLGYNCNYTCSHCVNRSGPGVFSNGLSVEDYSALDRTINEYNPKSLSYAGGEPTIYIDEMNRITSFHPNMNEVEVKIVTNGWFAYSNDKIHDIISRIKNLKGVNLSFDTFHKSSTKKEFVIRLYEYCSIKDLNFKLIVSISNPTQLLQLESIFKHYNMSTEFQPVVNVGRAKDNNLAFSFPSFQESTLNKKCPSEGRLVYIPRRGFSVCCSSPVSNFVVRTDQSISGASRF